MDGETSDATRTRQRLGDGHSGLWKKGQWKNLWRCLARVCCLFALFNASPTSGASGEPADSQLEQASGAFPKTVSQPQGSPSEDGKLCLVLSGGGARGAAHVGVLKVLEELRIPVDCILGTSMGSIVGALYAAGLSPQEMDEAFRTTDWADAFDDAPPRKQASFRRKEEDLLPLFPFELGIGKDGIRAPRGLIAGQKLGILLQELLLPTVTVDHFDELSIPFRAIAADLEDGSLAVLDRGSLAEAVRASMAVPGAFTPVERDGRVLIDGGVVSNLPVEIGRQMGGQRLIAVDIGTPTRQVDEDETALGVLRQTLSLLSKRNVVESRAQLSDADILITPELEDVSAASFDQVGQAMDLGEAAARQAVEALSRWSVSAEEYDGFLQHHRTWRDQRSAELILDEIFVTGSRWVDNRQIQSRLRTQAGKTLDLELLKEDLKRLYEIGDFEQVEFRISKRPDSGYQLTIDTKDKSWGPRYLRAGLTLTSDLEGESEFLALASYRHRQLNPLGAEWRLLMTVGDRSSILSEYFQPLDYRGFWFVSPRVELSRDEFIDPGAVAGGVSLESFTVGMDIGVQIKNYAEIAFGVETGSTSADSQLSGGLEEDRGGFRLEAILDQLDSSYFPRHGQFIRLNAFRSSTSLGADTEFERLEFEWFGARSKGRHTLIGNLRYGTGFDAELPIFERFALGGFGNLSGLSEDQLLDNEVTFGSLLYYQRRGKLYLGAAAEVGNVWSESSDIAWEDMIQSGLVFVGRKTFIGPLYVGYGLAEGGDDSFYLFLGQLF